MRNTLKLALTIVALALLCVPAYALEDFFITASDIQLTRCTTENRTITVLNSGDVTSTYTLAVDGDAAEWLSSLWPTTFGLAPGQSQSILQSFDTPCDATDATLTTVIGTATFEQAPVQAVTTVPFNDIELTKGVYEDTIKACGTAAYTLGLHNPAPFDERYTLNVTAPGTFKLKVKDGDAVFTIKAGENATKTVTVEALACDQSGTIDLTATIGTAKSAIEGSFLLGLTIEDEGIVSFGTVERIRTSYNASKATIPMTNRGGTKETYALKLDGPSWATLETPIVSLESGATEPITILLRPESSVAQGDSSLKLTATAASTNAAYIASTVLRLNEPTWVERYVEAHPWRVAGLILLALLIIVLLVKGSISLWAYVHSDEYKQRKQERKEARALAAEEKRKEAEKKRLADEKKRAAEDAKRKKEEANKKREAEKRESKGYFQRAVSEAEKRLRKEHVLVEKTEIDTPGRSWGWLWWVVAALVFAALAVATIVTPVIWTIWWFVDLVVFALIFVTILLIALLSRRQNVRVWRLPALRKIRTCGTGWTDGLQEIRLAPDGVVAANTLAAERSTAPQDNVTHDGAVYEYFKIDSTLPSDSIDELTLHFSVPVCWLEKHLVRADTIKLNILDNGWRSVPTQIVSKDEKFVHYSARVSTVGSFCIAGKPGTMKKEAKRRLPWPLILGILIILLVAGGLYVLAGYATPDVVPQESTASGIPDQYWPANTAHTVNLSGYFSDPDGDPISISYTPVEEIVVTVKDMSATFLPADDFVGNSTIRFIASDGKGGKVESNTVALVVYQPVKQTMLGTLGNYAKRYYVHALLLTIVIVAVLLLAHYKTAVQRFIDED